MNIALLYNVQDASEVSRLVETITFLMWHYAVFPFVRLSNKPNERADSERRETQNAKLINTLLFIDGKCAWNTLCCLHIISGEFYILLEFTAARE